MKECGSDIKEVLWNRLSSAILMKASSDIAKYAKLANRHNRNEKAYVSELKCLIEFIDSEWFDYLTNYNCPKKDIKDKLLILCDDDIKEKIKILTNPVPNIDVSYNKCAIIVDNEIIYDSVSECARKMNIHRSIIYIGIMKGVPIKGHTFKKLLK